MRKAGHADDTAAYKRWRESLLGRITDRVELAQVFRMTGPLRGKRVLDAGTGDGLFAVQAAARGAIVTAIDVRREVLSLARERARLAGARTGIARAAAERLPFADGSFDVILAVTLLCFSRGTDHAVLRELRRVLVPGGRLVLAELNRYSSWAAWRRFKGLLGSHAWRTAHFWTRTELQSAATAAGFCVTAARACVFFPPCCAAALLGSPVDVLGSTVRAPFGALWVVSATAPELPST